MKILLAADGSAFTKKALAFLVTHEGVAGANDELVVLHVQPSLPPRVKGMVPADTVADYHREEADAVLAPIDAFLKRHEIPYRCRWVIGSPCDEILNAATAENAKMIVMGTHGHNLAARFFMGSISQRVVARSEVPVLLVK
ncbi:MAG: UspA [Ramlibacter sp.]|jgi:nucleotide-binding universal stress UspA family protein|nr:UspA [Ramlibacter sp.]